MAGTRTTRPPYVSKKLCEMPTLAAATVDEGLLVALGLP
jgi:hypothetical protein